MTETELQPTDALDPRLWLERHGDALYRFALVRVRSAGVAEDLVQETLLAAWRGRDGYTASASERSWLTAILKHKLVDWLRKRIRERAETSPQAEAGEDAFDPFDRGGHWTRTPTDWDRGAPGEHLNRDEFWSTLQGCVGKLPPRLREAFVLRYLDERAGDEVCRDMGLTPANLWVMLHRARLRMAGCLSENWFGTSKREPPPC